MFKFKSLIVLCVIALAVAGCVNVPEVTYDKETAPVTKIGLLEPGMPKKALAPDHGANSSAAGAMFGVAGVLVSGAIEGSLQNRREGRLKTIVEDQGFDARQFYTEALISALSEKGFDVVIIPSADQTRDKPSEELPENVADVESVFDIATSSYGYLNSNGAWRPHVWTNVLLTRVADNTILLQKRIHLNDFLTRGNRVTIPRNETYAWKNFDSLEAEPEKVIEGLEDALSTTAKEIASLFE